MKTLFECPVCGAESWEPLAEKRYSPPASASVTSDYLATRLRILFQLWLPGWEAVSLTLQGCRECGFVCYSPRPEASDLDAKYRYLSGIEKIGAGDMPADSEYELRRAKRLFRCIERVMPVTHGLRVLDYGGGDGRLLRYIADCGARCFVIDYNDSPCPWVTRIGTTIQDMPQSEGRFDLVILSHVLEHVAEPVSLLKSLGSLLAPGGMLYCEVPMELWRRLPQLDEPVTHINFFTPGSLTSAMRIAGYSPMKCRIGEYWSNPPDHLGMAVQCYACPTGTIGARERDSDLDKWLNPPLGTRLRTRWQTPASAMRVLRHKLGI